MAELSVITRQADQAAGVRLEYDAKGHLQHSSTAARSTGTTVSVKNIFKPLPVRYKVADGFLLRAGRRKIRSILRGVRTGVQEEREEGVLKAGDLTTGLCPDINRRPNHLHKSGQRRTTDSPAFCGASKQYANSDYGSASVPGGQQRSQHSDLDSEWPDCQGQHCDSVWSASSRWTGGP